MPPTWLTVVAWIWLGVGFASAAVLLFDIFVRGHRQPMGVMEAVYPITAVYFGPVALLLYWRWGRSGAGPGRAKRAGSMHHPSALPGVGGTRAGPRWAT